MLKLLPLLFFCLFTIKSRSQVKPVEGDKLNYRLVGFSAPKDMKAIKYKFEVAEHNISNNGIASYNKPIYRVSDSNMAVIMLPAFNKAYGWRVSFLNKEGAAYATTKYYHFSTGNHPVSDTSKYRLNITKGNLTNNDYFIIVDNTGVIYNLNGQPVWHMPNPQLTGEKEAQIHCIKPTADGTFTAIRNKQGIEFNKNGKVLWESPTTDKVGGIMNAGYHHEFTKLKDGHYLIGSNQLTLVNTPPGVKFKKSALEIGKLEKRGDNYYAEIRTDNISYYTQYKQAEWYWRAIEHIEQSYYFETADFEKDGVTINKHMNSFYYDEKGNAIYACFADVGEILKIEFLSNRVLKRYGIYRSDTTTLGDKVLRMPGSITKGPDGNIYVITHLPQTDTKKNPYLTPHITALSETKGAPGFKQVKSIPLEVDKGIRGGYNSTGSVAVMNDGSILASSGQGGKLYIVNADGETIWQATAQYKDDANNWQSFTPYRINYITKTDLERFINK